MPSFGRRSEAQLVTCHAEIELVCRTVIPHYDFTVLCGRRGKIDQDDYFRRGLSMVEYPNSKHNCEKPDLSDAIDIAPWFPDKPHIRWKNPNEFYYLAGHMMMAAAELGFEWRYGGDWDSDQDLKDQSFMDLGHFERLIP